MKALCAFIGVPYHEILTQPTKMGTPWSGNSSRGIAKEKVSKNEHKAPKLLKREDIIFIGYVMR